MAKIRRWRDGWALRELNAELEAEAMGEFELGISVANILDSVHRFAHKKSIQQDESTRDFRQYLDAIGLKLPHRREFVTQKKRVEFFTGNHKKLLDSEQRYAVDSIAYAAQRATGHPARLFVQGYLLYMRVAKDTHKLDDFSHLGFKEMMTYSQFTERPERDLCVLEDHARQVIPLLCGVISDNMDMFKGIVIDGEPRAEEHIRARMVMAGAATAYNHCEIALGHNYESVTGSVN